MVHDSFRPIVVMPCRAENYVFAHVEQGGTMLRDCFGRKEESYCSSGIDHGSFEEVFRCPI